MRKITAEAVRAFYNGNTFRKDNTEVECKVSGANTICEMFLHGNLIARLYIRLNNHLYISSAGWETNTTKERLNGILPNGMKVKQIKGEWFLCNENEKVSFKKGNELNEVIIF